MDKWQVSSNLENQALLLLNYRISIYESLVTSNVLINDKPEGERNLAEKFHNNLSSTCNGYF